MTARPWFAAGLCVLLSAAAAPAQPREEVGFVISVQGEWQFVGDPKTPLRVTAQAPLRAGDILRKVTDDRAAHVVVAFYTGRLEKYSTTTKLPQRGDRPGFIARVIQALRPRVHDGTITAAVRGGADLRDAIAREETRGIDLTDVFDDAPAGAYTITVFALDDRGGRILPARATTRIDVGRSTRGPALAPGLYQIDASGGPAAAAGIAWVRVVTPAAYRDAANAFRRLSAEADSRDADLRAAARAVTRAYLLTFDDAAKPR